MIAISVKKKMWKNKLCVIIAFTFVDSLGVRALPAKSFIDNNNVADADLSGFKILECPENEFLNDEGKACEPTCDTPIRPDSCTEQKIIACECDDGYLRNTTGACVKPDECGNGMPPSFETSLSVSKSNNNGVIIDSTMPVTPDSNISGAEVDDLTSGNSEKDKLLERDYSNIRFDGYTLAEIDQLMKMNSEEYDTYQKNHRKQYLSRDGVNNEVIEEGIEDDYFSDNSENESYNNDFIDLLNWDPVIY